MKKFILAFLILIPISATLKSQSDCLSTFPPNEGTVMVNTTYDADDQAMGTTIYRINKIYNLGDQPNMEIGMTLMNNAGEAIDHANININCDSEYFQIRIEDRSLSSDMLHLIAERADLIGNYLNYPIFISENYPDDRIYELDRSELTIRSNADKDESIDVKIKDRKFEIPKSITTPAGTFEAWKLSFDFDVISEEGTKSYKANEWYADGKGLVRSETYDENNNLLNYSVLTTFRDKE